MVFRSGKKEGDLKSSRERATPVKVRSPMLQIRHIIEAVLLLARGLWELMSTSEDMPAFERGMRRLLEEVGGQLLSRSLEAMDDRLLAERDREWQVVHQKSRRIITWFGEMTFRRRLYRHRKTGETRFLLDERLGIPARERWSPLLKQRAVELATVLSYEEAAKALGWVAPGVSKQAVWELVQQVGGEELQRAAQRYEAFYERGEAPKGRREAERLRVEGDGVVIKLQHSPRKTGEIKLFSLYEEREPVKAKRRRLKGRRLYATLQPAERAWEEVAVEVARGWSLDTLRQIDFGGDGADWLKRGAEYFPGVESRFHLDRFHLRRALLEGLGHDEEAYRAVAEGMVEKSWPRVEEVLRQAERKVRGERRERVRKLAEYLRSNWGGIEALPEEERLGVMEGLVRHVISRRMKRGNARWSERGGEIMARMRVARANGELHDVARPGSWQTRLDVRDLAGVAPIQPLPKGTDPAAWLEAHLPALVGPHAARPWVRHVLRGISQIPALVAS